MLRKLLTLFVLLSGLAAAGAPAQARMVALEEVRLEAASALTSPCAASQRQAVRQWGLAPLPGMRAASVCRRPTATVIIRVPAVMLGADRARE